MVEAEVAEVIWAGELTERGWPPGRVDGRLAVAEAGDVGVFGTLAGGAEDT